MLICIKCNEEFKLLGITKKNLLMNPEKYKKCKECRLHRLCENCGMEFKHTQNQTCSKECAHKLKEKSFLKSCGTKHNFYKNSSSRKKWEQNLLQNEGITNVFQRESVKEKSRNTIIFKYGVSNISQSMDIKKKKKETLYKTVEANPTLYKDIWIKRHNYYMETIGYNPMLHLFGKASKSSLIIFEPLVEWCIENNINKDDIYIGIEGNKEYFIRNECSVFFYDFTIKSKKIIIEYNGVAFHAKSESQEWFNPFTKETAKEYMKKRKIKTNTAYENGFKLLEIWSDEEPIINLEICKKFILENYENKNN